MNQIPKYIAIICLLAASQTAFPQTAEETLEWISINKHHILGTRSRPYQITIGYGVVDFLPNRIKLIHREDTTMKCFILYKDIKKIEGLGNSVKIISSEKFKTEQVNMEMIMSEEKFTSKFIRAIQNMAKLAGAKLVEEDLF